MNHIQFLIAASLLLMVAPVQAREWSDATGKYKVKAELLAHSDTTVVLEKKNHDLVSLNISELSPADQEYLASEEAAAASAAALGKTQNWTMRNGLTVAGNVVAYGRREINLSRRYGHLFVNDRKFDNLPEVYRRMLRQLVNYHENLMLETDRELQAWAKDLKGQTRQYTAEGVMLELANGDHYAVPFLFFSDDDLKVLQPGWDQWVAADKDHQQREQESLLLQAQAQAYQQNQMQAGQVQRVQLALLAAESGVTNIWEVALYPKQGSGAAPCTVMVPGANSRQATLLALEKFPQYTAGPVRKVNSD